MQSMIVTVILKLLYATITNLTIKYDRSLRHTSTWHTVKSFCCIEACLTDVSYLWGLLLYEDCMGSEIGQKEKIRSCLNFPFSRSWFLNWGVFMLKKLAHAKGLQVGTLDYAFEMITDPGNQSFMSHDQAVQVIHTWSTCYNAASKSRRA